MIKGIKKHKSVIAIAILSVVGIVSLIVSLLYFFEWNNDVLGGTFATICAVIVVNVGKYFMESGSFEKIYQWQSEHLAIKHQDSIETTKSPTTLNDVGTKTLREMKGEEWLNDNIDALYKKFKNIDNNYDIQERSRKVLLERIDKIQEDRKDLLYSTGTNIHTLVAVMAIRLRDMVIERKEHNIE